MSLRISPIAAVYYLLTLSAAISLQFLPAWIIAGLVTDVVEPSAASAMDNRINAIFQYQIWAGALLAACFALTRDLDNAPKLERRVDFYLVVTFSVISFAIGFIHFEVIHYFKESGTYIREFDSRLGLLHSAQSAFLMWSMFIFARLVWRRAGD